MMSICSGGRPMFFKKPPRHDSPQRTRLCATNTGQ
jgi:hypothetical protein